MEMYELKDHIYFARRAVRHLRNAITGPLSGFERIEDKYQPWREREDGTYYRLPAEYSEFPVELADRPSAWYHSLVKFRNGARIPTPIIERALWGERSERDGMAQHYALRLVFVLRPSVRQEVYDTLDGLFGWQFDESDLG